MHSCVCVCVCVFVCWNVWWCVCECVHVSTHTYEGVKCVCIQSELLGTSGVK